MPAFALRDCESRERMVSSRVSQKENDGASKNSDSWGRGRGKKQKNKGSGQIFRGGKLAKCRQPTRLFVRRAFVPSRPFIFAKLTKAYLVARRQDASNLLPRHVKLLCLLIDVP